MTDKFKQIADCYGPGDFNDLHAIDIQDYVLKAAKDVHLMWDEIQRLRKCFDMAVDHIDTIPPCKSPSDEDINWCVEYEEGCTTACMAAWIEQKVSK